MIIDYDALSTSELKSLAHVAFDRLWKSANQWDNVPNGSLGSKGRFEKRKRQARDRWRDFAYRWLSAEMGISRDDCHFAFFTRRQLEDVHRRCRFLAVDHLRTVDQATVPARVSRKKRRRVYEADYFERHGMLPDDCQITPRKRRRDLRK